METLQLPNPADRSAAWFQGVPSYQAWCDRMTSMGLTFEARRGVVQKNGLLEHYGENALNIEALSTIASHGPIHELGAGNGYNAALLAGIGCDVIASDLEPARMPWFPVASRSYEEFDPQDRTPLLVWPFSNAPTRWLSSLTGAAKVIVVNDVQPGNLANRGFGYHELLSNQWRIASSTAVTTGWRLHADYVHVWERQGKNERFA